MSDDSDPASDPWTAPPLADDDPWTQPDPPSRQGLAAGSTPPRPTPPPLRPDRDPWSEPTSPSWSRPAPPPPVPDRTPRSINTGLPASLPASPPGWEAGYPDLPPNAAYPPLGLRAPGFAPADPAAVSGPPWPALIAGGGYTPPRLITWPILAGCGLLVAYIVIAIAVASSRGPAPTGAASWLLRHDATISTLNADQAAIDADQADPAASLADWRKLRADAEAAASLPNPGGAATAPWREMLNDYVNAATNVLQAEQTNNPTELQAARQILAAAGAAAAAFNAAVGTG